MLPNRLLSRRTFARRHFILVILAISTASFSLNAQAKSSIPANSAQLDPLHAWYAGNNPATLEVWVNQRLAAAQADVDKVLAVTGPHTVQYTLRPYDDAVDELALAGHESRLLFFTGDSASLRSMGQRMVSKVSSTMTDLSLNQKVYRALVAVPIPTNNPATKHYLERTLLEYRLAGVDKDAATRAKVHQLQDKITAISLTFSRNINDAVLKVPATKVQLAGLPADYIARHKPDANGIYTLTTNPPDAFPVFSFAKDSGLRLRMFLAYNQRAYPENKPVLMNLWRRGSSLPPPWATPTTPTSRPPT